MKPIHIFGALACVSCLNAQASNAAEVEARTGPYVGIGLGTSGFELESTDGNSGATDLRGGVLKVYGGYQASKHFGAEMGYLRTGHVSETLTVDGVDSTQTAKTRAVYMAATARLPVTESFSVHGRLGMSFGDVNGDDTMPGPYSVFGRKRALMGGFGAQYRVNEQMSVALDLDNIAKESDRVSVGMLSLTVRRSF